MLGDVNAVFPTVSSGAARSTTADRATRVPPVALAVMVSAIAAIFALVGYLVVGLSEGQLVITTLLVASLLGWLNVSPRSHSDTSSNGSARN
jgi:hypothetical protein